MLETLKTLFNYFLQICLFQKGPQDLPASRFFLATVIAFAAFFALLINLVNLPFERAIMAVILNLGVVIIITHLILWFYNKPSRLIQTLTALMGAGIVISIFGIPVVVMLQYSQNNNVNLSSGIFLWLVLFVWEIAVTAHILRHALSTTFLQGFIISILYPLVYFQVASYFLSPPS